MRFNRLRTTSNLSVSNQKGLLRAGVAVFVLSLSLSHAPAFAGTNNECGAAVNGQLVCDALGQLLSQRHTL